MASLGGSSEEEIAVYDANGRPRAYIVKEGRTIYLWDGTPVAYLYGEHVYGFNGAHLGWFDAGIVRDSTGARLGFLAERCPSVRSVRPVKSVKSVRPVKSVPTVPPVRPVDSLGLSDVDLEEFFRQGI